MTLRDLSVGDRVRMKPQDWPVADGLGRITREATDGRVEVRWDDGERTFGRREYLERVDDA
jgi:hypothetical protein